MIRKITELKNVGKFENYKASDVSFGKFNGVYSDNGQGKSTLTAVLRSFAENNGKSLIGRKTVSTAGDILCKLETDKGFRTFKEEAWDQSDCRILVFDAQFVNQNIYSGMHVGIDHRRRLYQFIIGEAAIHLNEQVNVIAESISELNSKIGDKKSELNKVIGQDTSVDEFVVLSKVENVDDVISAKAKEVTALTDKDTVLKRRVFSKIAFSEFDPKALKTLLNKNLEDVSADSEAKVKRHINDKLGDNGEDWIKQGVVYQAVSQDCPFCGNETSTNSLVTAYKDYFNESYIAFKNKIDVHLNNFRRDFTEALSEKIKKVLSDNDLESDFWNKYVAVSLLVMDEKQGDYFPIVLEKDVSDFFDWFIKTVAALLDRKSKSPLEVPSTEEELAEIETKYTGLKDKVDSYNLMIDGQNAIIQHHKSGLGSSDIETEKKSLRNLKLSRARHGDEFKHLAEEYIELSTTREALIAQKKVAQQKLDDETNRIPKEFQKSINYYLDRFGAEFKIVDKKKVNPSGQAATEYKLSLRGVEISLGDNKTPEDVTSFQNTLSEGDKSTLAFSYFLARLDSEKNLADTVLVFDDPISSLDRFRRGWTRNILRVFGEKSKQLIVLSHDPTFLEEMAHNLRGSDFKCFEILWDAEKNSSVLGATTAAKLNQNDHMRNIEKVRNYLKARTGSPEDVKARLRHLCEYYLRGKYPRSFHRKDALGGMIGAIRDSSTDDLIFSEKERLTDFEVINDYSIEENHSQDGTQGKIDGAELLANCKTTFQLIEEPVPE